MRILHVNTTASRGGAALIARRLQLWQREVGLDARFLVARDPTDTGTAVVSLNETRNRFLVNVLGYRILGREGLFNRGLWKKALAEIGTFDVVHIHNAHGYYMPSEVLAALLSRPVVWTLHDFWLATGGLASPEVAGFWGRSYPIEWIDRSKDRRKTFAALIEKWNPVLVAPSLASAEQLREIGLPHGNLHVVHHGIFDSTQGSDGVDRSKLRKRLGWPRDTHVFVFASSSVDNRQKGFDVFLEALSKLPRDRKWLAYVVGGTAEQARLKVEARGITGVQFAGGLENSLLMEYFRACDTYVTATFSESYGLTVVEALGEGATVVCSDLPVLREVTAEQASYFPVGDGGALADRLMERLQAGDDQMRDIRAASIRSRFSRDNMVASYAHLYSLAMGRTGEFAERRDQS